MRGPTEQTFITLYKHVDNVHSAGPSNLTMNSCWGNAKRVSEIHYSVPYTTGIILV